MFLVGIRQGQWTWQHPGKCISHMNARENSGANLKPRLFAWRSIFEAHRYQIDLYQQKWLHYSTMYFITEHFHHEMSPWILSAEDPLNENIEAKERSSALLFVAEIISSAIVLKANIYRRVINMPNQIFEIADNWIHSGGLITDTSICLSGTVVSRCSNKKTPK